ncbi:cation:proton antiporter [Salsuginibacillus kocurii]|uniref:cation:proton antiporter domain-containing protein n=1 Tax=Salsuginibacillus kocurii TaxID=427078 RepID=UPI0003781ACB|nr:cation:proton antiporter [Salsuginibacillus kocurii]
MFERPISDPVLVFLICMIIFLLMPMAMRFLKLPGLIGPILAGILIGPHGFGLLHRGSTIELLGTVGLLLIIFIAGLEMDIEGFKNYRNRSFRFGFLSFFFPFLIGTGVGLWLDYSLAASILLGSILSSHTLLGYPIASRLGLSKNKAVTTAVGGTLVTDSLALLVLAIVAGSVSGELNAMFFSVLMLSLFFLILLNVIGFPLLTRWFFQHVTTEGITVFTFIFVLLFISAFFATVAGFEPIIGAFVAGLALNRLILERGPLMNRIRFTANALFIPFFLLSVGMLMDVRLLVSEPRTLILTGLLVTGVIIGKFTASLFARYRYRYNQAEVNVMFGLTIPQAAATLAATLVGYDLGLLDQSSVNGVIVMILVTCILGPSMIEKYGRYILLNEERRTPEQTRTRSERIMLPMTSPESMQGLLDLAMMLRKPEIGTPPIYSLGIIPPSVEIEKEVARVEELLADASDYATAAEVPVQAVTRVGHNVADTMGKAVIEERITLVITRWKTKKNMPQRVFGSIMDQFLNQTTQSIMILHRKQPLDTLRRVLVILPKGMYYTAGFSEAMQRIQLITKNIGATLCCVTISTPASIYQDYFAQMKPDLQIKVRHTESWKALFTETLSSLENDTLVVLMSCRKGTIAWHPELNKLPTKLEKSTEQSFLILYPTERKQMEERGTTATEIPLETLIKKEGKQR